MKIQMLSLQTIPICTIYSIPVYKHINDDIRQQIIATNLSNFDNIFKMRKAISKDCNGKIFSEFLLYTKSSNTREKYPRDWLIYSSSKKTLHCFPCLLFSEKSY